jgi:2-polyprenyl-3-methyl-5-hydroxy-6-metoxy-1,4-benzoquinol methylase
MMTGLAEPAALAQQASYGSKPEEYFGKPRRDYVAALPVSNTAAILEIGCGDGATGALALAERKCATYVGIELFESMALRAKDRLTDVLVGDVETMALPLAPASFDVLIASEVLEHLIDPGAVLKRLVPLMRPGALVFASSPCLAHWSNIVGLVQGRFDYTETGMMDRTHLRWFTPNSFAGMFRDAGFTVDSTAPLNTLSSKASFVRRLLGSRFDAIWHYQIDLRGHVNRNGASRLSA